MKLLVTTPLSLVLDVEGVTRIRAEDETGSFGILPGHADFLTVLAVSVLSWSGADGAEHHIAVRGGVLRVANGGEVSVAAREAVSEDALDRLGAAVLERFQAEEHEDEEARISTARLHLAAMRQLQRYLSASHSSYDGGNVPGIEAALQAGGKA